VFLVDSSLDLHDDTLCFYIRSFCRWGRRKRRNLLAANAENKVGPTAGDTFDIKGMPYCWTHLIPEINALRRERPLLLRQSPIAYNRQSTNQQERIKGPTFLTFVAFQSTLRSCPSFSMPSSSFIRPRLSFGATWDGNFSSSILCDTCVS
jgi:hypothetical protein